MFRIRSLFLALILLNAYQSLAQFDKDISGNPILTPEFVKEVIQPMEFQSIDGQTIKVDQLKGKIVIIDFWQTWCGPCLKGFKHLQKAREQWPDAVEILAASPDWADKKRQIKRFMKNNPYDFHFIWAGDLENQLSLKSIPYKIILAPDGSLIKSVSDTDGMKTEYEQVKSLIKQYFE